MIRLGLIAKADYDYICIVTIMLYTFPYIFEYLLSLIVIELLPWAWS